MRITRVFALIAVVALALAGGIAYATIPDSDGVIHGCYKKNGQLRVIDPAAGGACGAGETSLDWNVQGSPGAPGPQGLRGPQGEPGISLFAVVSAEGTLISGTATQVEHAATGQYVVSFDREVTGCAGTATPVVGSNRTAEVVAGLPEADAVFVGFWNTDNPDRDRVNSSFNLIVAC